MRLESVGKRYGLRQPWVALAANVSPANAALRSDIASNTAARWPSAVSLIAATALLLITWTASALAAARRERSLA
jgi:hypothetical protein